MASDFVRFAIAIAIAIASLLPVLQGEQADQSRFVFSEGGFFFHSELFPGGSDHVKVSHE